MSDAPWHLCYICIKIIYLKWQREEPSKAARWLLPGFCMCVSVGVCVCECVSFPWRGSCVASSGLEQFYIHTARLQSAHRTSPGYAVEQKTVRMHFCRFIKICGTLQSWKWPWKRTAPDDCSEPSECARCCAQPPLALILTPGFPLITALPVSL